MDKNKKILILFGVLLVIVLAILIFSRQVVKNNSEPAKITAPGQSNDPSSIPNSPEDYQEPVVDSVKAPEVNPLLKDTHRETPTANPINKDNKVLTLEGKVTKNDVSQSAPEAPYQSAPVKKDELPASVIKLDVSAAGFSPKEISAKAGAPITISLTATDSSVHTLVFSDSSLSAIALSVFSKETRAITFNAPAKAGEYIFFCNVGGSAHSNRGEMGKLIVK